MPERNSSSDSNIVRYRCNDYEYMEDLMACKLLNHAHVRLWTHHLIVCAICTYPDIELAGIPFLGNSKKRTFVYEHPA